MSIVRPGYLQSISKRLEWNPVVSLLGPRQVGKTTLAKSIRDVWMARGEETHFFDLESPVDLNKLANPEMTLSKLGGLVILDEIQRMPILFQILRVLADRPESPAKFLILGSASTDLVKGASESLAGRVSFIDVTGFSLAEIGNNHLFDRWWRGGFPRAYTAENDERAHLWHCDFITTFLETDIPKLGIEIPSSNLRRFWTMVAHYHAQVWNGSELARALGSTEPTASRYLNILAGTFMVRRLPPWFENLKKRQVKASKIYLRDSGILHTLLTINGRDALDSHPKVGASWEGFALEQILAVVGDRNAYFWSTHGGAELDLLLFHKNQRIGIEFKYSEAPKTTKSMHVAIRDLDLAHLYIVHPGEHQIPFLENITAIPLPEICSLLAPP